MIKKAVGNYDPRVVERDISEYWKQNEVYNKLKSLRSDGERIYFLDGPPYTSGDIHIGTALNKLLKDFRIRYWRMHGFNVRDQPGWDMHGLPIEVQVEKSFNTKSKKDIEKIGIDTFVKECKKYALTYLNKMTDQFIRLGVWMDWGSPYMTIKPEFTDAAWAFVSTASENGLLFEGERSTQWCSRCATALADAEIEYVERKDPSIYVKLKVRDKDEYLLVWTTTPWTIPSNMAVAVHPDKEYALVEFRKSGSKPERLYILEEKAEEIGALTGQEEYEVIRSMKGSELVGTAYEYPLEGFAKHGRESEWAWKVLPSETVETEYTALVHTAPGHGPEDFALGMKYGIDIYSPVADDGTFIADAGEALAGKHVGKTNDSIIEELESRGLMYHRTTLQHRYGTCWRCKTPIIYRSTNQWYVKATELRIKMVDEINKINWIPDWAGSSRQTEWARNLKDWCISRQRYWGTPMPVWRCSSCNETKIVGSVKELSKGEGYEAGMDLHRPAIDQVTFSCGKCGSVMRRIPDVMDVWLDSGVCSWASLDYPSKQPEFKKWWPSKWIVEAGDQTRGWFNSQLTTSLVMFGKAPFESAMLHGWVNDAKGRPMHKSLGNVVDPMQVMDKDGADALRFYLLSSRPAWEDLSYQPDGPRNAQRMLNILWNVYNFASTYMELDSFTPRKIQWKSFSKEIKLEDKWLLSTLQETIAQCSAFVEKLEIHRYCRHIEKFIVDDLSRWYVKLVRGRTWTEGTDPEKESTYVVLHHVLSELAKLLAPAVPYISEEIYRALNPDSVSVHLASWPEINEVLVDQKLESDMTLAREMTETILKSRQETGMKLRWPLQRFIVKPKDDNARRSIGRMLDIIEKQSNSKSSKLLSVGKEWDELVLAVIPNPNAIGKVYRQWSGKIALMLKARPAGEIINGIRTGSYNLGIEGQTIKIEENMVSFSYTLPENVAQMEFSGGTVYIDFNMNKELEMESLAREVMRRIQKMRKDLGLRVDELVVANITASGNLLESILEWKQTLLGECRISDLVITEDAKGEMSETWKIDQNKLVIALSRQGQVEEQVEEEPEPEANAEDSDDSIVMDAGGTYAVFEEKSEKAFALFSTALQSGVSGMCVAREFPEKISRRYGLEGAHIIWLSSVGDQNAIKPNDLEKISLQISDFFRAKSGIALLDGIEYLISNNNFQTVVRLVQHLRDLAAKSGAVLLLSLNPVTLSANELGLLRKEVDNVI